MGASYTNVVSGFENSRPAILADQFSRMPKEIYFEAPATHHTAAAPLNLVDLLSQADSTTYSNWAATGGYIEIIKQNYGYDTTFTQTRGITYTAPERGLVTFVPDVQFVNIAGILNIQAVLKNRAKSIVATTWHYGFVTANLAAARDTLGTGRYFSLSDIRQAMKDSDPVENRVLQTLEFSDTDLIEAMAKAMDTCVMSPPRLMAITVKAIPQTMVQPLLDLTVANLLDLASTHAMRNDLKMSQEVGIDFGGRSDAYANKANRLRSAAMDTIAKVKISYNVANGTGVFSRGGCVDGRRF